VPCTAIASLDLVAKAKTQAAKNSIFQIYIKSWGVRQRRRKKSAHGKADRWWRDSAEKAFLLSGRRGEIQLLRSWVTRRACIAQRTC